MKQCDFCVTLLEISSKIKGLNEQIMDQIVLMKLSKRIITLNYNKFKNKCSQIFNSNIKAPD